MTDEERAEILAGEALTYAALLRHFQAIRAEAMAQALGYAHGWMCSVADRGRDVRHADVACLLADAQRDLGVEVE